MGIAWQLLVVVLIGAHGYAAYLFVAAARIEQDEPGTWFRSGWLRFFGFTLAKLSSLGLVFIVLEFRSGSTIGLVTAIVLNVLWQPVAMLFCWTAICKFVLGLCGRVVYAWWPVPEAELAAMPPETRRMLSRHCVFQGLFSLPYGVCVSIAFASPLIVWFIE